VSRGLAAAGRAVALLALSATPAFAAYGGVTTPAYQENVGTSFEVTGWAIDFGGSMIGTGVDQVDIYTCPTSCTGSNATFRGTATYGLPRPDIEIQYDSSRVLNSGFSFNLTLAPGTYQVQARAHSTFFGVWTTFTRTFNVTTTPPQIVIETPASNGVVSAPFVVSGWAVDPDAASGTGMDTVQVFTCPVACTGSNGTFRGMATYGLSRPDVATLMGNSRFTNSGFSFTFSTLPVGQYEVQLQIRSTYSAQWYVRWVRFMVAVSSPHMGLDTLPTSVAQPFAVTGWGLDSGVPSGTGVDHVQVWAYPHPGSGTPPVLWGTATLGQSRPDVAEVYGSQFATSGYQFTVSGQPPGAYLLNVNVYYLSGTVQTQTRTIYVDTPTVPVTIDRQGMGTGSVSASGLTCPGGAGTQGLPCGAAYPFNTAVTLTAVPDTGSAFGGWSGACSGSGACQVTLDQARFVAALFTKTADTPTTSYYHVDAQGSVRAISDDSGAIVIRHDYYTFGEDAQPLTGDPLRYAGKELDPETAQEYFGARYYRNVWGRFGTVDPIYSSAAVTDPQQWNRYAYARNNPLKFSDPLGATVNDECAPSAEDGNGQSPVFTSCTIGHDSMTVVWGYCVLGFVNGSLYWWQCQPGASLADPWSRYDNGGDDSGSSGGNDTSGSQYVPPPPPVNDPAPQPPNDPSSGGSDTGGNNGDGNGQQKDHSDPCKVPLGPPGASVQNNVHGIQNASALLGWHVAAAGWLAAVWNHSTWDYKRQAKDRRFEDFGNFNYAATGRALHFTPWMLHEGASLAQGLFAEGTAHFDDPPEDVAAINAGIAAFDRGCFR
jgi:RHS repeat-associated protein